MVFFSPKPPWSAFLFDFSTARKNPDPCREQKLARLPWLALIYAWIEAAQLDSGKNTVLITV